MKNFLLLLAVSLMVQACGFEPLYVQREKSSKWYFNDKFDSSISEEMAKVKVNPIADRFGQLVRNQLLDLLTPKGAPKKPQYRLEVVHVDRQVTQQAMRRDITATSERVSYKVRYELWEGTKVKLRSDSIAFVSYDIMANPYSTTMAHKKTESDAAKIIANDIALRLGAYFHKKLGKGISEQ